MGCPLDTVSDLGLLNLSEEIALDRGQWENMINVDDPNWFQLIETQGSFDLFWISRGRAACSNQ